MYAVTRTYTGAAALVDALTRNREEVERLITTVPGFVSYYAFRSGDGMTSVTVCEDKAGAEETTRRAADWVGEKLSGTGMSAPQINVGEVFLEFAAHTTAHARG